MPNRKAALWAFILGIAAIILSLFVIGGLFGLIAAILAVVALVKPGPKGLAVAGLVTGIFSIGIASLAMFFWIGIALGVSHVSMAKTTGAQADISNIKNAIAVFELDVGRYPTTAEGLNALTTRPPGLTADWHGPYLAQFPTDPWGHAYIYVCPGVKNTTAFDLSSAGPDGIPGTRDDITPGLAP
jgi:type II secretion system protein G